MRRTASEVISELETRIARLERQTRTASVMDFLRSLPNARQLNQEVIDSANRCFNEISEFLYKKSMPSRNTIGEVVTGETRGSLAGKFHFDQVSESDMAKGKLTVPCSIPIRMFYRAPEAVPNRVQKGRLKGGTSYTWGYTTSSEDMKEKATLVNDMERICKKNGVDFLNIDFPRATKGVYSQIYATLTFTLDMSHYL